MNYKSGIYELADTLVSSYGCDSIYTLQLVVATKHHVLDSAVICPGDTYNFRGQLLTEAGLYHDTLPTTLGCDSIFSLHLSYLCASYDTICQSDSYEWRGKFYQNTGVYYDSLKTIHGYDSVFVEYLQVMPNYRFVTNDTICRGEVYEFRGKFYTDPGIYNDSLLAVGGCDSIYQLRLVVHPSGTRDVYEEYCNSESYHFLDSVIDLSQFTTDTTLILHEVIHNSIKCDSTVVYHISVHPTYHFSHSDTVGLNEVYVWSGHTGHTLYDGLTQYTSVPTDQLGWISLNDSLRTVHGCDSIWTLRLYVAPTYVELDTVVTICHEESPYEWRGYNLYTSGVYSDTLISHYGTDSIRQLQLTVLPLDYTITDIHLCAGDSFALSNRVVYATGVYNDTLSNAIGCDSIVEYRVTVHEHYHFTDHEIICEGDDYVWRGHGFMNYKTGVYEINDSLISNWGCDSVYTLQLIVAKSYKFVDSATICPGDTYNFRGQLLTEAGWYHDTLQTPLGCDSIYSMHLSYLCVSYDTICHGDYFDFNGKALSQSGVYVDSLKTITGFDSVLVEYLHVDAPYAMLLYDTICSNEWYDFNGVLLNESGVYYDTLVTIGGCDSVEILNLYVASTTLTIIYDTLCIGDSYIFHNQVLTEEGVYADTTINIYGCQHIDSLYLAKIEPTQIYVAATEFCADDRYLNFAYTYDGKTPIGYSIRFSEEAKVEGFVDVLDQTIDEENVVSVPYLGDNATTYPRPGDYTATLFLQNGTCSDSLVMQTVNFRVKYPSWIMEQNWNDVIAILVDSLNGGYNFSEYQWYHNGRPIYGENKPYLYVYPALDMNGEYTVELTRVGDGQKIMTCPIYPSFVEDHTVSYEATIVVTPTIMSKMNPNCTLYSDQNAQWYIYSTDGLSLTQGVVTKDIPMPLTLPAVSTTYFMVVRTETDYVKFIKLIVQ